MSGVDLLCVSQISISIEIDKGVITTTIVLVDYNIVSLLQCAQAQESLECFSWWAKRIQSTVPLQSGEVLHHQLLL